MTYAIYGLFDPRQPIEFLNCRYVGQTIQTFQDRLKGHVSDSKNGLTITTTTGSGHCCTDDIRPVMMLIEEATEETLDDCEIFWIARAKRLGCRLVNDPGKPGGKTIDVTDLGVTIRIG